MSANNSEDFHSTLSSTQPKIKAKVSFFMFDIQTRYPLKEETEKHEYETSRSQTKPIITAFE